MLFKKKLFIYFLTSTGSGFGSEINNILYLMYYTKNKKIDYKIDTKNWNATYRNGWNDYFNSNLEKLSDESILKLKKKNIDYWRSFFEKKIENIDNFPAKIFYLAKIISNIKKKNRKLSNLLNRLQNIFFTLPFFNRSYATFGLIRRYCFKHRNDNYKKFCESMNNLLNEVWVLKNEIKLDIKNKTNSVLPSEIDYICIHIRRGDKVRLGEDLFYDVDQYIDQIKIINTKTPNIFLMGDDYKAFEELKRKLPNNNIYSFLQKTNKGHQQREYNSLSNNDKKRETIQLITEIEIARNSKAFIGTFSSNLFRLIEYFKIDDCYDITNLKKQKSINNI